MKYIICLILSTITYTQSSGQYLDERKHINVTGSADMSISPDQLTLSITLAVPYKEQQKIEINEVEYKFHEALEKNGISKDQIAISTTNYPWYNWWYHRNNQLLEKTYNLTLRSDTDFMKLMQSLDIEGIKDIRITSRTHKDIHKHRVEVKKDAMKSAKEKANYMLESIGEKIGSVISVVEVNNNWRNNSQMLSNYSRNSANTQNAIDEVTQIKLRYEVNVKFEIK